MEKIRKFLEFNGKTLAFLSVSGIFYIALKPICEALGVDYIQQFKNTKEDPIFGPSLCKHTIMVPGSKQSRQYICIPEKYVYGWLISIRSDSPELLEYKRKCYDLLYDYFHGTITRRKEVLQQMHSDSTMQEELRSRLAGNPDYTELCKTEGRIARAGKELKQLDTDLMTVSQLKLWQS